MMQPYLAFAIGFIGALIAFLQWRTAHQKVVLELFERRFAVFQEANELYRQTLKVGSNLDAITVSQFHTTRTKARFLFGQDVNDYLKYWHEAIIDASVSARAIAGGSPEKDLHIENEYRNMKVVLRFPNVFLPLCERYMKLDQKVIRTPVEWFRYRNGIRKSYQDY